MGKAIFSAIEYGGVMVVCMVQRLILTSEVDGHICVAESLHAVCTYHLHTVSLMSLRVVHTTK
jgi:hypothetical protein